MARITCIILYGPNNLYIPHPELNVCTDLCTWCVSRKKKPTGPLVYVCTPLTSCMHAHGCVCMRVRNMKIIHTHAHIQLHTHTHTHTHRCTHLHTHTVCVGGVGVLDVCIDVCDVQDPPHLAPPPPTHTHTHSRPPIKKHTNLLYRTKPEGTCNCRGLPKKEKKVRTWCQLPWGA